MNTSARATIMAREHALPQWQAIQKTIEANMAEAHKRIHEHMDKRCICCGAPASEVQHG